MRKKQAGLWIDHKEAFLIFIEEGLEETQHIESGVEKHVRFSGHGTSEPASADNLRDRQFAEHLSKYYDTVITPLRDAESLFIFGPGEAKGELKKRLITHGLGERIVGVESADKMTAHQIRAKVLRHYQPKADTLLYTDWSHHGMGAVLTQACASLAPN